MERTTVVTEKYVSKICDDIGTCWHDLGTELNISLEILCNIESDKRQSREKAREMLSFWIKNNGSYATVQCLIDALNEIGQRRIAEKLLALPEDDNDDADQSDDCGDDSYSEEEEKEQTPKKDDVNKQAQTEAEGDDDKEGGNDDVHQSDDGGADSNSEEEEREQTAKKDDDNKDVISSKILRTLKGHILSYESDFDKRGVIYCLGKKFGRREWSNPSVLSTTSGVKVTWSGCGSGKPEDLLEYFQPRKSYTGNKKKSWWCVDLGEQNALLPTHYTLRREEKKSGVLRNWEFQGLCEGEWKALKTHQNCVWKAQKTWAIEGEWGAIRRFRIVQTGVNSVGTHVIHLSGFELYGVLFKVKP